LLVYGTADPADCGPAASALVDEQLWRMAGALLFRTWQATQLLVWHAGLLQLLPLIRARGKRVVLFLHGIEVWRQLKRSTRRLLPQDDLFLSNSSFTWQRFLEYQPHCADRPHIIVPLGWGAPLATPTPPAAAPIVLMLGRLVRDEDYKGHREVIAAWPQVRERVPDAQLWIAGDGDLRPVLERLARDVGVAAHVRFCGRVDEAQKAELLPHCRGFAMPSRGGGFGLVYLEAMRVGRPCLVSDADAGREVVNPPEAGLAVATHDQSQLVNALCRLLGDGPEWHEWSRAARTRYESMYTARHFQERLLKALFDNCRIGDSS
jgi:phosphatidylinositol alpha-1,6-mannosyltransferase